MIKLLRTIARTGTLTEPPPPGASDIERLGPQIAAMIQKRFKGSLAIRQVDAGSCSACELEIHALGNPYYDISRFGLHFVASPRHADVLLVTGPVTTQMSEALRRTYAATPDPKWVIASGDCADHCGLFGEDNYAVAGRVSEIVPVDLVIKGCPPAPVDLMRGLLQLLEGD
ncbi:MAG: hydrogenase [Alphaproteobacteria bacterium CG_4_10_14_0_2_um_filter_63_37]|nr:MAG: hydrogenase [Proteobacteria bacterium CG1_02_64_396]PJA25530.1 MAG: hydrogenase [Alphaproteobacteria bacterium CG_4_10_14_0_2_um_filter_63_37]